jgi:hypothetical protein
MVKTIKVVDVVSNNNDSIDEKVVQNDIINEEIEKVIITEEVKAEPIKEDKQDYKTIRTQQLVECPKCKKMMTSTSLKYYHKKTCPAEPVVEIKPKPKAKPKPKKEEVVIEESDEEVKIVKPKPKKEVVIEESDEEVKIIKPKPKKAVVLEQPPVLTFQQQRMQQRQHKINTLFMGAI